MESTLERQVIRAAVAMAVASAHGQSPESIAELRDEAAQLISLCVHPPAAPDDLRVWCDNAIALVSRMVNAGSLPEEQVLYASAAILRLRLAATRATTVASQKKSHDHPIVKREAPAEPKPKPEPITNSQKKIYAHISEHPGIRTTGIVEALANSLSVRTVKRILAQLMSMRLVQRTSLPDGGASFSVK